MKKLLVILTVVAVSIIKTGASTLVECPKPWTIPSGENGMLKCECGSHLNEVVECDPDSCKIKIMTCHCISYNDVLNTAVGGYCLAKCSGDLYEIINACNYSELDDVMCRVHHRTGQMCGQCEKGYASPVYSYNLDCVECSHYKYNWLKYIVVAFPLFYIIMVIFKIGVLSKELQAYILLVKCSPLQHWYDIVSCRLNLTV